MAADGDWEWDEREYVRCLRKERARYAWVMRLYGEMTPAEADKAAEERYPYQPAGATCRGLIFHDDAWHWAMLALNGSGYWHDHPELATPPEAYHILD